MTREPLRIDIKGSVPIPVGDRVEVWLLRVDGGMLGQTFEEPMVRHTNTGILYGPSWAYRKEGSVIHGSAPSELQLHSSVKILAQWAGRVLHCRIASTRDDHMDQITTLLIERGEGPPYR